MSMTRSIRGVSLIEVMVTLVIIGFGLLGVMRMQATAIASTSSAGTRALVALQARSLSAAMRANPAFWADPAVVSTRFSMAGAGVSDSGNLDSQNTNCIAVSCTPVQLAAFDLRQWAIGMNQMLPSYEAEGECTVVPGQPVRCRVAVMWEEKQLGVNEGSSASASTAVEQTFVMLVQP
jgi:type IV pilus assembly protein PilV